jgi:hypothetical protein
VRVYRMRRKATCQPRSPYRHRQAFSGLNRFDLFHPLPWPISQRTNDLPASGPLDRYTTSLMWTKIVAISPPAHYFMEKHRVALPEPEV